MPTTRANCVPADLGVTAQGQIERYERVEGLVPATFWVIGAILIQLTSSAS
jgi:hypothetical protein